MNEPHVTFGVSSHEFTEVLRLDKEGMHYKGELVRDAGEAHKIFLSVMKQMEEDTKVMCALGRCVGLIWGSSWVR